MEQTADRLVEAARALARAVARLRFPGPVAYVYNPLQYAWPIHQAYLRRFGTGPKQVLFVGMNPGPFGMLQTGVPFGEVAAVRHWLGLEGPVGRPARLHPKRPVEGFGCRRCEVSGRRLWGLFARRFGSAATFFAAHFVVNYCPLGFFDLAGRNLTPDRLPPAAAAGLIRACDCHLRQVVAILQPQWVIGIGDYAARRARLALNRAGLQLGQILHPSPANPAANRAWEATATRQLQALGVWPSAQDTKPAACG